jgi:hypothetical protein
MPIEPNTALQIGIAGWEQRKHLRGWLRGFKRYIKKNDMLIVVFGAGGVGKTTLGMMLSQPFSDEVRTAKYKESTSPEEYWLTTDPNKKIIVAPGQENRRDNHWPQLFSELGKVKQPVIVNVVSFGYHSLSESKTLEQREGVVLTYFEEMRQLELSITQDLADYFSKTVLPIKMITLVTKQDLWWNERDAVQEFYERGEYRRHIERLLTAKGTQHFVHEYGYVSLSLQNLKTADGQILSLTTAGYDDTIRFESLSQLTELINRLIER